MKYPWHTDECKTAILITVFSLNVYIITSGVHIFSKHLGATTKFWAPVRWPKQVPYWNPKILGATVQKLVAWHLRTNGLHSFPLCESVTTDWWWLHGNTTAIFFLKQSDSFNKQLCLTILTTYGKSRQHTSYWSQLPVSDWTTKKARFYSWHKQEILLHSTECRATAYLWVSNTKDTHGSFSGRKSVEARSHPLTSI